ncbi:hypothetical protein CONPUDRAFT_160761, partial [Coniophora puteana RWD-64-598 SS2]
DALSPLHCLPLVDAIPRPTSSSLSTPSPSPYAPQRYPSPPKPVRPSPPPAAPLAHPPAPSYPPPDTPETPSPSYSTSSSPASTASPKTPHGIEDHTARIVLAELSPVSLISSILLPSGILAAALGEGSSATLSTRSLSSPLRTQSLF